MKTGSFKLKQLIASGSVAAFALLAAPIAANYASFGTVDLVAKAHAEEHADKGSDHADKGGKGGAKKGKGGHETTTGGASKGLESTLTTTEEEEGGKGKMGNENTGPVGKGKHDENKQKGVINPHDKGDGEDSADKKGPRAGSSGGSGGGKPVWAQEGIPEVELGRLNVARSPSKVFQRQVDELSASIDKATSIEFDAAGRLVLVAADGTKSTVDSPLTNLAVYKNLLTSGSILGKVSDAAALSSVPDLNNGTIGSVDLNTAAKLLGAASDKTVSVSTTTVEAINKILGIVTDVSITYTRSTAYSSAVMNDVFKGTDVTKTGIDGFAQEADDARAVIQYYHDN